MNQNDYGNKLIELGKAFKNPKTKLKELVDLAFDCNLIVRFTVEPDPKKSIDIIEEYIKKVGK